MSNSSSSSYVIALPSSFDIESYRSEIKKLVEDFKKSGYVEDVNTLLEATIRALKYMTKHFEIYVQDDDCFDNWRIKEIVHRFLVKTALLINNCIDGASDDDRYFNILADNVRDNFETMMKNSGYTHAPNT